PPVGFGSFLGLVVFGCFCGRHFSALTEKAEEARTGVSEPACANVGPDRRARSTGYLAMAGNDAIGSLPGASTTADSLNRDASEPPTPVRSDVRAGERRMARGTISEQFLV